MIRLHDTRHTTATSMIFAGVDEQIVAQLLGHDNVVARVGELVGAGQTGEARTQDDHAGAALSRGACEAATEPG